MPATASMLLHLKRLIVSSLGLEGIAPETIGDDTPLMDGGLGLDSVDALELVVHIERQFGVRILLEDIDRSVFASVASLAAFLETHRASPTPPPS